MLPTRITEKDPQGPTLTIEVNDPIGGLLSSVHGSVQFYTFGGPWIGVFADIGVRVTVEKIESDA